ncbi:uncharacterized protein E6C27_scaffold22949G00010 [Cucumis melo var. makuwa]|uniref:Uncharacterized protein n=1 Tax=Cucumis melo var. makuwa TaxID=1194695 RepID=A0A5A7VH89_CUCMM|nr:uncharacterized protein E6C27_scaffold22949G00010 [Cucumis melo var. makuwa]
MSFPPNSPFHFLNFRSKDRTEEDDEEDDREIDSHEEEDGDGMRFVSSDFDDADIFVTDNKIVPSHPASYNVAAVGSGEEAFLSPPKYAKRISPPSSMTSFSSSVAHRYFRRMSPPNASYLERSASSVPFGFNLGNGFQLNAVDFWHQKIFKVGLGD